MNDSFSEGEFDVSVWDSSSFLQLVANKLKNRPAQITVYSKDFKFFRMFRVDTIILLYKYPLNPQDIKYSLLL